MEPNERPVEHVAVVEGPAPFLDVVFETIEAHVTRTESEYAEIITGVRGADVGDVDRETDAVLHVYVLGEVERDEVRELIDLALDRIADEHNMDLARHSVRLTFEEGEEEEG